jgi:hypothetical protein
MIRTLPSSLQGPEEIPQSGPLEEEDSPDALPFGLLLHLQVDVLSMTI